MSIRRAIAPPPNNAAISKYMCVAFGISLIAMGFACESPGNILIGLREYILCEDILLTDYFVIGSIGAAFVNAGLVTLISIALTLWIKTPYTGSTIAMIFLMGGFALFGKTRSMSCRFSSVSGSIPGSRGTRWPAIPTRHSSRPP